MLPPKQLQLQNTLPAGKLSHDRVAARIVNQPQAPSAAAVAALVARPDVNAVLVRGKRQYWKAHALTTLWCCGALS